MTIETHGRDSHPRPHTQLLPLFSLAKTAINSDILITPLDQFFDRPGKDPAWEEKTSSKLVWRGSSTGISMMTQDLPWRNAHRIRLHNFANNHSLEPISFLAPHLSNADTQQEANAEVHSPDKSGALRMTNEEATTREAMEFFFDMKLSGAPLQCSEDDGTCSDMWWV